MLIRVAILDKDTGYMNKVRSVFEHKYMDKTEVYAFSDIDVAKETIAGKKIGVLLVDEKIDIDLDSMPRWCSCAYMTDRQGVDRINNRHAFCKFQKAETLYKEILGIYAENADSIMGLNNSMGTAKVVAFTSVAGGCGTSSAAAACAMRFVAQGKRVFYLNLEAFGSADTFFHTPGIATMSDIIYALKNKKGNLQMKIESAVRKASCDVAYFAGPSVPMHMMEFTENERMQLIAELKASEQYDYIIVDSDFSMEAEKLQLLRSVHQVVFVNTGSETANQKTFQALNAIAMLDQDADVPLAHRAAILYNMFSKASCKTLGDLDIQSLGGIPRFEHANTQAVLENLAASDVFDKII